MGASAERALERLKRLAGFDLQRVARAGTLPGSVPDALLRSVARWVGVVAPILLLGCASACCEPERLPHAGRAETPRALFDLVKHAGYNDCDDLLYDLLSSKTHEEVSRLKFTSFWDSDRASVYPFPPPEDPTAEPFVYTLAEVIRGQVGKVDEDGPCAPSPVANDPSTPNGAVFDSIDDTTPPHLKLKVTYERPHAPGQRRATNVQFRLLVVPEKTADGRTEWRLGIVEQLQDPRRYGSHIGSDTPYPDPRAPRR